jgi:hypothetical protein
VDHRERVRAVLPRPPRIRLATTAYSACGAGSRRPSRRVRRSQVWRLLNGSIMAIRRPAGSPPLAFLRKAPKSRAPTGNSGARRSAFSRRAVSLAAVARNSAALASRRGRQPRAQAAAHADPRTTRSSAATPPCREAPSDFYDQQRPRAFVVGKDVDPATCAPASDLDLRRRFPSQRVEMASTVSSDPIQRWITPRFRRPRPSSWCGIGLQQPSGSASIRSLGRPIPSPRGAPTHRATRGPRDAATRIAHARIGRRFRPWPSTSRLP